MKSNSSIKIEFSDREDSEERKCAELVSMIIKKYNSDFSGWLSDEERKILANDSHPSVLKDLALQSTSLIRYDK